MLSSSQILSVPSTQLLLLLPFKLSTEKMPLYYEALLFIPTNMSLSIHKLGTDKNSSYFYLVLYIYIYIGKLFNNQNDRKKL
jgi:hypothetical protein